MAKDTRNTHNSSSDYKLSDDAGPLVFCLVVLVICTGILFGVNGYRKYKAEHQVAQAAFDTANVVKDTIAYDQHQK